MLQRTGNGMATTFSIQCETSLWLVWVEYAEFFTYSHIYKIFLICYFKKCTRQRKATGQLVLYVIYTRNMPV